MTKKELNKILNQIKLKKYPEEIDWGFSDKCDFFRHGFDVAVKELNRIKKKIRNQNIIEKGK